MVDVGIFVLNPLFIDTITLEEYFTDAYVEEVF